MAPIYFECRTWDTRMEVVTVSGTDDTDGSCILQVKTKNGCQQDCCKDPELCTGTK